MNAFLQTLRNLGPARLATMAGVAIALVGFFVYLTMHMSSPNMALLYGDLQTADAGAITQKLDALKVTYEVSTDGTKILVPADQVGKMRMAMAQAGLPSGGSIGYEIFDKAEGFGATSFIQNINHLRALEGELARTVSTVNGIMSARVHLVLPRRELFSRSEQQAQASVFLRLRPGVSLSREQVSAIQHLIAAAVPQLDTNRVSIVDDHGNLLARGNGSPEETASSTADEKRAAYEHKLTTVVEDLLGRSLGYGKVRAQVNADLDFDKVVTNSEIFDPDSQVVRSTQTVNENNESKDKPTPEVTVANNLPTAQANTAGNDAGTSNKSGRTEETINYEISRTVKNHTRESGQVRRLSVAVLVDGTYEPGANGGVPTYVPRSDQDMQQITKLVQSAVGYDPVRGDTVEVVNMRFAPPEGEGTEGASDTLFGFPKADIMRIAETLVLAIVAILVLLLVVRPLLTKMLESSRAVAEAQDAEQDLLADHALGAAQLTGPGSALAKDLALEDQASEEELEQMIDINRVEGRVRASSLRKVGEIVEKHPEEAVSIIRSWLYQET